MSEVFKKHKQEIDLMEKILGEVDGRIFYAFCILSDVQEMVKDKPEAVEEINEVKQLLGSILIARQNDMEKVTEAHRQLIDIKKKLGGEDEEKEENESD